MAETKYERIQAEQDAHGEQDEIEFDISGDRTAIHIADNTLSYSCQEKYQPSTSIMQTPSAILALIFVYFGLSISLTFYQRDLLKVCTASAFPPFPRLSSSI